MKEFTIWFYEKKLLAKEKVNVCSDTQYDLYVSESTIGIYGKLPVT